MNGHCFQNLIVFICFVVVASRAQAFSMSDDDDTNLSYDVIVNSLNRQVNSSAQAASKARAPKADVADPLDSIWMHAGVGYVNVTENLSYEDGNKSYLNMRGVQASLGIDLFSENWMAEGTVRSFGDTDDAVTQVYLKEFELKIYYKERLSRTLGFRIGGGLAGRYMTVERRGFSTLDYSTPSSVGTLGLDLFLSERFSVGADLSGRAAMVAETLDRNSYDATLRLDAHF